MKWARGRECERFGYRKKTISRIKSNWNLEEEEEIQTILKTTTCPLQIAMERVDKEKKKGTENWKKQIVCVWKRVWYINKAASEL